ncbi:hypothetical protein [Streptomyces sp. NRRL S-350]|uniref:hypothetical protein n=1 Tax=Streptomyces sp. NRRL S-350 TaxID=1463902 RepID=UPI00131C47E1|nr:hypothetical protein [Streptomyces sp. NRRL S-350]
MTCQPRQSTVHSALRAAGFVPYRPLDRHDGQVVPARSGYVLEPGEGPGSLRLTHTDITCDEDAEAVAHLDMRLALDAVDGLVTQQVDAARARNVAVHITADRKLTDTDTALLAAAGDGLLLHRRGRWRAADEPADARVTADLLLSGWIRTGRDGHAELTAAGAAILAAARPVPAIDLQ